MLISAGSYAVNWNCWWSVPSCCSTKEMRTKRWFDAHVLDRKGTEADLNIRSPRQLVDKTSNCSIPRRTKIGNRRPGRASDRTVVCLDGQVRRREGTCEEDDAAPIKDGASCWWAGKDGEILCIGAASTIGTYLLVGAVVGRSGKPRREDG